MLKKYAPAFLLIFSSFWGFSQSNMLKNPSFEESFILGSVIFDDWNINFNTISTEVNDATDGDSAVKIQTNRSGNNGFFAQLSAATPSNDLSFEDGKTYTISFDYKVATGTITELRATLLRDNFYLEDEEIKTNQNPNGWQTFTYDFTAAFTAAHNFDINLIGASANAEIIIDNTSVIEKLANPDRDALIAFYNATDGPNWKIPWDLNADMNTWYGLSFNSNGRLILMSIQSNDLGGVLPPEIGLLTELEQLYLNENDISGNLPAEFANLDKLFGLSLVGNRFSGEIPSYLGDFDRLTSLSLGKNEFSGEIPEQLGNLTNLKSLYLHDNKLTGAIKPSLENLNKLELLELRNNELSGNIPDWIGNLTDLEALRLENNQLNGDIPLAVFSNLTSLIWLTLNDNNLTGSIPTQIGNLQQLKILDLSNNNLQETIPSQLGEITELITLKLNNNSLSGEIPNSFENLTLAREIWLSYNNLSGNIPAGLANLTEVKQILLDNNSLTGSVPIITTINLGKYNVKDNNFVFKDLLNFVSSYGERDSRFFSYNQQKQIDLDDKKTLELGETYTLSVMAADHPENEYQWRKNRIYIEGATSSTYEIANATSSDAAIYDCLVKNPNINDLTLVKKPIVLDFSANVSSEDIEVKTFSTSCPNVNNGKIKITFKNDYTYEVFIYNNSEGFRRTFRDVTNAEDLILENLPPSDYNISITIPEIPVFGTGFTVQVENIEELQSGKIVVDDKKGKVVVSGSKNYEVFVNSKKTTYSFADSGNHELKFDLEKGENKIVLKTDKECQGKYEETILVNEARVFPNPTSDKVQIVGLQNTDNAVISIASMSGTVLKTYTQKIHNSSITVPIDFLPQGIYLIRMKSKKQDVQTKVVKK